MSFSRAKATFAPVEEDLGRWGVQRGREVGQSWCKESRRDGNSKDRRAQRRYRRLRRPSSQRWTLERMLGWLMRNCRLSTDYERKVQTSETYIKVPMIRLILKRWRGEREPYQTGS
ncbi:MAG: transposase [Rubrobacter sp.]|nr:transposase [Rubrobacter sp.]